MSGCVARKEMSNALNDINIGIELRETGIEGVDWIYPPYGKDR
jgi:hypothetical protein